MKTKLNTGVSIQANKLYLATSYVAWLQHRICAIASIAVTTATIALWLKYITKHISSRCPYLCSRKVANSMSLLSPYKSRSILHLWNDTLVFILVFSLAQSSSFSLHCFQSSLWTETFSPSVWTWTWSLSDQVRAGTAGGGGCQQCRHESDWHFSDTPLGSDWLYRARSDGFLLIKLQPLGRATDSGF